ncbi:MAG: leucine-rich repeat domain-containing protein [Paludibacteraceae bacterium]|nr:leucine-rich repeat domain-containing protein [Paludibacteraceae bacterium]
MRKFLLLFTALLLSVTAMAYDFKVDGLCYAIVGEGYSVEVTAEADFNNNYPDLVKAVIPNYVEYDNVQYRVLGLGENAFNCAKNLESIEFSRGDIFYIKPFAAANCPKLKEVDLVSVSEIGNAAFAGAALESIRIWWGIEKIGNQIFMGCKNLTEIKVDENNEYYDSRDNCNAIVETKTNTLIMGCNASTIPSTVTTIGRFAFQDCENLTIEHLPTNVIKVGANSFDGTPLCPYTSTPQEGAHYIDHILYKYYSTDYETPKALVVKEGTLGIAEYACAGIKLSSLTLPSSLKCISAGAFTDTQLSQLSLPASVERIEEYAFSNNALTNVTIPENVKYVGEGAFEGNSFTSITWNAIECETEIVEGGSIRSSVFGGLYSLKSFTFGNTVKTIPNSLCGGLGYDIEEGIEIILPNSVEKIGHRAFAASGIKTITIPENVKSIGNDVFDFCLKLTSSTWNAKNCTRISQTNEYNDEIITAVFGTTHYLEEGAEEATILGVKSITFGSGVTNIPQSLCQYNDLITSVTLPSSVKSIEMNAFAYCENLSHVTLGGNEESIHPEAFYGTPWWDTYYENLSDGPIYLGKSLVGYKGEMPENTTINVKEGTVSIVAEAFYGQDNLVAVTFPESLEEIGASAFNDCANLKEITIPKNVTKIGENAFNADYLEKVTWNAINCESPYKEIIYGDEVSVENRFIFYADSYYGDGSSSIKTFIFGNEVESIPDALCYGMSAITEITIPNSVKSIGKSAFEGCSITEITIPEGVSYVGGGAFRNTDLKTVDWNAIDVDVDKGEQAGDIYYSVEPIFGYSEILTSFTFGNKVKTIPERLCYQLPLQSLTIPESVETIEELALNLVGEKTPKEVFIPKNVKSIASGAIQWGGLEQYIVDEDNTVYASKDGILYIKDFTKIVEIPWGIEGEITIPAQTINLEDFYEDLIDSSISAINVAAENEFYTSKDGVLFNKDMSVLHVYPSLKSSLTYEVPSQVVEIDTMAFYGSYYLKELSMSDNVTKIGALAFVYSPSLESVKLSSSLKMIPHFAFEECASLKSVTIPEGVEKIGEGAFAYCDALTSVIIPSTVTKIASEAFTIETENLRNVYCYATTPPAYWVPYYEEEEEDGWSDGDEGYIFTNFNANLHVPASALEDYKFHPMYQDFKYIMAMGVVTEPTTDVTIKPSDDNALFTWPVVDKAVSYTLEITFEGELFCTLDFNAYGQLTALNFKRSADATPAAGFQFTVTGLEGNTEYGYTLEAKDSENKVLDTYTGTFTTGTPTAVEEVSDASISVSDGTISCDADFSIYNTVGQNVTSLNGSLQSGIYVVTIGEDKVKVMVK